MSEPARLDVVREIQSGFEQRTGVLQGTGPPQRYLWTDAFAVCNLLEIHRVTGEGEPLETALVLVEQVHGTLGRHHPDDSRTGWISGLEEEQGRAHPTCRGLRIGKPLPERGPDEPFDERLEWDRDGQYFHYLTKWMHALARVGRVTSEQHYLGWGLELARAAHAGFVIPAGDDPKRMIWKASVDLTRPLVSSMGHHDPLDGLLTFQELQAAALAAELPGLDAEIADMRTMCAGTDWTTDDPLGLGGLLSDAYRLAQFLAAGQSTDHELFERLLLCAARGLIAFERSAQLTAPASQRLGFRELGLAIGLHGVPRIAALIRQDPARLGGDVVGEVLGHLLGFERLAGILEEFWLDPVNQASASWQAHLDIDEVMLATSLAPEGYLSA